MTEVQHLRYLRDETSAELAWLSMQAAKLRDDIAAAQSSQAAELVSTSQVAELDRFYAAWAHAEKLLRFYERRIKTLSS